ncbi:MAG: hypothetical protein ACREGF_01350, partial [Candidatus Saccharimonadales bacterium]
LLLVAAGIFIVLIMAEGLRRRKIFSPETTRKFVHILTGTFAAFWPYFLSWGQIEIMAGALLAVIFLSKYFNIFKAIHLVERRTFGEILFAVAIGLVAIITHDPLIFMAAILHMSLADGLAGVAGKRFGRRNSYTVFGQTKSIVGSATFWLSSLIIISLYFILSHAVGAVLAIIFLPLIATALEAAGAWGIDNFLVPVFIALALTFA